MMFLLSYAIIAKKYTVYRQLILSRYTVYFRKVIYEILHAPIQDYRMYLPYIASCSFLSL